MASDAEGLRHQLVSELIELLRRTAKGFNQKVYMELRAYDLTVPQMWVLRSLSFKGPVSLAELSRRVDMSTSNVSGIVDRLVKLGLVNRTRDDADRRIVWLELSSRGLHLASRVPAMHEQYFNAMLQEIADADLQVLVTHLRKLVAVIEEETTSSEPAERDDVGGKQE